MKWDSFIQILKDAEKRMKLISKDLPHLRTFLKRSHLIVTYGTKQFNFKKELSIFDMTKRMELISEMPLKNDLIKLLSLLSEKEKSRRTVNKKSSEEIDSKIDNLKSKLSAFPLRQLEIIDNFNIQIIFPSINMESIQIVKQHQMVNKENTCLCQACIRVFLY